MADTKPDRPPTSSRRPQVPAEPAPGDWPDVKRYLVRLVSLIAVGLVIMISVATYVWFHYGGSRAVISTPEDLPPTPSARPNY